MDDTAFRKILKEHQVVVVHFSHHAVMAHKVVFPDDLKHALETYEYETRSCCAIYPGHCMDLPGSVGLIFDPQVSNILSVSPYDSGSSDCGGEEGSLGEKLTEETLRNSVRAGVGHYNEWRVVGAKPKGIFIANTEFIFVKKHVTFSIGDKEETHIVSERIHISKVFEAFPDQAIYTQLNGELVKLN